MTASGSHLAMPLIRQVVVELRDQNVGKQVRPCHTARDRAAGGRFLHHPFAVAAGFLDPGDLPTQDVALQYSVG